LVVNQSHSTLMLTSRSRFSNVAELHNSFNNHLNQSPPPCNLVNACGSIGTNHRV
jgi:hypothetical protein